MASFWQQFLHSKRDFWYQKIFTKYIFWESDEPKNSAIIFDGFDTRMKRFHLVSNFFRAYLTKVSPRDLKYGSVEADWSMDIIKWPSSFNKTNRSRDIL